MRTLHRSTRSQARHGAVDRALLAIVALGLLLTAPALGLGFYVDDYTHQLVLEGAFDGTPMQPANLYDFGEWSRWQESDVPSSGFPWWVDPDWKVRFFRPLTSALLRAEHALFGATSWAYHLVHWFLFGCLIVACHGLYRELGLDRREARAATLLVAVGDSAALPVGWIANVNSLLCALFAVVSARFVLAHRGRAPHVVLALFFAVAAVLSKEAGVVALGVAALFFLFPPRLPDGAVRPRSTFGAATASAGIVGYFAYLVTHGYGTKSLFYATPWDDPARWLANASYLGTAGLAGVFGPFPIDVGSLLPELALVVAGVGAILGAWILTWVLRRTKGSPSTRFLLVWAAAFALAQAGAFPADRLLFVSGIGVAGLLGQALARSVPTADTPRRERLARRALWVFAVVGSGLFLLIQSVGLTDSSSYLRERALQTEVGDPELGHRDLFLLQSQTQIQAFCLATTWAGESADRDLAFWPIQAGNREVRWTVVDEHTFELESLGSPFTVNPFERVYLSHAPDFEVGDTWTREAFTVEALAVRDGWPTDLRFRTTKRLDDPTLLFLRSQGGVMRRVEAPAVGSSVVLEPVERDGPPMP